jgi:hypothetical protein
VEKLNKILREQVVILKTLHESYTKKEWAILHEQAMNTKDEIERFRTAIELLDKNVQEKLGNLAKSSQDLIQLLHRIVHSCLRLSANMAIGI